MKKMLMYVACVCALASAPAHAFMDDYTVYFINGMGDDAGVAKDQSWKVKQFLLPDYPTPTNNLQLLFTSNSAVYTNVLYIQSVLEMDASYNQIKKNLMTLWGKNGSGCSGINNGCLHDVQAAADQINKYNEETYVNQPSLRGAVEAIKANYTNNPNRRKTIILTYGQGSYFANQAWNYLYANSREISACVGIVEIATPAVYVANSGQYTSNDLDEFLSVERDYTSWGSQILPANYTLDPSWLARDPTAHNLIKTYLKNDGIRSQLRGQITLAANKISSTCVLPTPPPPPLKCKNQFAQGVSLTDFGTELSTALGPGHNSILVMINDFGFSPMASTDIKMRISYHIETSQSGAINPATDLFYGWAQQGKIYGFDVDGGSYGGFLSVQLLGYGTGQWAASLSCN